MLFDSYLTVASEAGTALVIALNVLLLTKGQLDYALQPEKRQTPSEI